MATKEMTQEQKSRNSAHQRLLTALLDSLLATLTPQKGVAWTGQLSDTEDSAVEPVQTAAFSLTGALRGTLYVQVNLAANPELRAAIPGTGADPALDPAERLVSALRAPLAEQLTRSCGVVAVQDAPLVSAPKDLRSLGTLSLQAGSSAAITLSIATDGSLEQALQALARRLDVAGIGDPGSPALAKIDRVLDVPLAVTLRFGQRQLSLREVLALGTGSLVELDRQVEEPVDLVLGDRLIARGEVVIVDGNYGLRVTEVMESANRNLRQLEEAARSPLREVQA